MQSLNFGDCNLVLLDELFSLKQILNSQTLQNWLITSLELSDFEKQVLARFQQTLILNVFNWNEIELLQNFIGPIFTLVDFTTENTNFFSERHFSGKVNDIELQGKPDGMIASGFRQPKQPYFCFQEYKKSFEQKGDPIGQCLAAMLVAQEMNECKHPIYGCFVVGADWYFMVLEGQTYATSSAYVATKSDIFDIFRILKNLKAIVINLIANKVH